MRKLSVSTAKKIAIETRKTKKNLKQQIYGYCVHRRTACIT